MNFQVDKALRRRVLFSAITRSEDAIFTVEDAFYLTTLILDVHRLAL